MNGTYQNIDCMELMANLKDKSIDLAIVDPPYGIGEDGGKRRVKIDRPNSYTSELKYIKKNWDIKPNDNYFKELFRVSKNQIIWGGNYLLTKINIDSSCWIVWDKNIGGDQADCELAWTSFKTAIRKFFGHPFIDTNGGKERIHPTQKPVKLYEWLLTNYAKPNDLILDTHCGSASSLIACENLGFKYIASELDKDYYSQSLQRLQAHLSQGKLFQRVGRDEIRLEQPSMLA